MAEMAPERARACVKRQAGVIRLTSKAHLPNLQKTPRRAILPGQRRENLRGRLRNRTRSDHRLPQRLLLSACGAPLGERTSQVPSRKRTPFPRRAGSQRLDSHTASGPLRHRLYRAGVCAGAACAHRRGCSGRHAGDGGNCRTLLSGIYYEKPPASSLAAGLYSALSKFIEDEKKRAAEQPEVSAIKDSEIFLLLVFFLRFGRLRSNGRPRTRGVYRFPARAISRRDGPHKGRTAHHRAVALLRTYVRTENSRPKLSCRTASAGRPGSRGRTPRSYFLRSAETRADISRRYASGAYVGV